MIGAILAGGGSRRFGGRPKADLPLEDGTTMIERVESVLRQVTPRIVVIGHTGGLPDVPRLEDRRPGQGPLAGLETLLDAGLDDDAFLVCPCDMPALTAPLLRRLGRPSSAAFSAFRVPGEAMPRPLPLRVSVSVRTEVKRALDEGRRAVAGLLTEHVVDLVDVAVDEMAALENINEPDDINRLRS